MNRCCEEFSARRFESKSVERTRDEQVAQRPVRLPTLLVEHANCLEAIETADELAEFTERHVERLTATDFERFAALMLHRHGAAFVRRAGLPAGTPIFRVA